MGVPLRTQIERARSLFGSGGQSIVYCEFGNNLIEVIASDTAGNASAPATGYGILLATKRSDDFEDPLRFAADSGWEKYEQFFRQFNESMHK